MKTAMHSNVDQERVQPANRQNRQLRTANMTSFIDNRPEAIARRKLAEAIYYSPRMTAQRMKLRRMSGKIAQFEGNEEGEDLLQGMFTSVQRGRNAAPAHDGSIIQRYTKKKGKPPQGGNFIYGNAQIHLHIDIGRKSHLKIEGDTINIASKGGNLDAEKIQAALNTLLEFKETIAKDKQRARNYQQPIQDCVGWMVEQGASLPTPPIVDTPEDTGQVEEKQEPPPSQGYGDFFANMGKNNTPSDDDDFI